MQITPQAISHLIETREKRRLDPDVGARVAPGSSGVSVWYGRAPQADDKKIDGGDIDIYVADAIVEEFNQAVIDVANRDDEKALVIRKDPLASQSPS